MKQNFAQNSFTAELILALAHSPIKHYIAPGLTSYLVGTLGPKGLIRLFKSDIEQQQAVTPHSHRFNFQAFVLAGKVTNRLWESVNSQLDPSNPQGDPYQISTIIYGGEPGKYEKIPGNVSNWTYQDKQYLAGESYSMQAHEIHSIMFSRGAIVLFFEGPKVSEVSVMIEPFLDGKLIPTGDTLPWMFQRD